MIATMTINGQSLQADFSKGICVGIPVDFNGLQPSHFAAERASTVPMRSGSFIGDTKLGGSCNVPVITINPHCNGTHTESIGHIVDNQISVHQALPGGLKLATLISVEPASATAIDEHYRPALVNGDKVITKKMLHQALQHISAVRFTALLIRTLPNDESKLGARYGETTVPPFFTIEAIDYLNQLGVRHLLVDMPSVDRMQDEGLLTVHHRFWSVAEGTHSLQAGSCIDKTITEMIYVPDEVRDGNYLLDLQIPAFSTDVAPSRPWLFPVEFV